MSFVVVAWLVAVLAAGAWLGYRIGTKASRLVQIGVAALALFGIFVFYSAFQDAEASSPLIAGRVLLPVMVLIGLMASQWRRPKHPETNPDHGKKK